MSGHFPVTDAQRRERPLKPDRDARFRQLYREYLGPVARYAARRTSVDDVQDVVSETFLIAWRRLDAVPRDALPWLFVTARHVMANRQRADMRRRALDKKLAGQPRWHVDPHVKNVELDERLEAALEGLPASEREALLLVAWDGLTGARAARAAGCSAGAFRVRLHRARRRLEKELGPERPFVRVPDAQPSLEETR